MAARCDRCDYPLEQGECYRCQRDDARRELERLKLALHAAIVTPKGIVPACAEEFFDQNHPALAEHEWRGWRPKPAPT